MPRATGLGPSVRPTDLVQGKEYFVETLMLGGMTGNYLLKGVYAGKDAEGNHCFTNGRQYFYNGRRFNPKSITKISCHDASSKVFYEAPQPSLRLLSSLVRQKSLPEESTDLLRSFLTPRRPRRGRKTLKGGKLCPLNGNNDPKNIYELGKEVAGSTWILYEAKGMPHLLIKRVGDVWWRSEQQLEREIRITKAAGELGLAPILHYAKICKASSGFPVAYLVFENIQGTTISEDDPQQIAEVNALLRKFNDAGYTHGDISFKNAMWGTTASSPGQPRAWLIDFEMSKETPPKRYEVLEV